MLCKTYTSLLTIAILSTTVHIIMCYCDVNTISYNYVASINPVPSTLSGNVLQNINATILPYLYDYECERFILRASCIEYEYELLSILHNILQIWLILYV